MQHVFGRKDALVISWGEVGKEVRKKWNFGINVSFEELVKFLLC